MTASTPGISHTERAGLGTVLPARVAISIGRKKTEGMRGALAGDKAGVVAGTNKDNKEKITKTCERGVTEKWIAVSMITSGIHPM